MLNELVKKYYKVIIGVFLGLLVIFLFNECGFFNLFYKHRLNTITSLYAQQYKNFVKSKVEVGKIISNDDIVQSALIQYTINENLIYSLQHLNMYKKNFFDIRSITLFNSGYDIVLTTELENYIVNKNLSKDWFVNSLIKNYFISDIHYNTKYNDFLISIIIPIKNIVEEGIGYLMIDYSVNNLFKNFSEYKGVITTVRKDDFYLFTCPVTYQIKNDRDLDKFALVTRQSLMDDYTLIVCANKKFFTLPLVFKLILLLFFILISLFVIYYLIEKNSGQYEETQKKIKELTNDILKSSQTIPVADNIKIKEMKPLEPKKKDEDVDKKDDFIFIE